MIGSCPINLNELITKSYIKQWYDLNLAGNKKAKVLIELELCKLDYIFEPLSRSGSMLSLKSVETGQTRFSLLKEFKLYN